MKVHQQEITIRQDGPDVLLIMDGKLVARMPWDAAQAVARAIRYQAGKAEEIAIPDRSIMDDALMLRTGAPVRLAVDPRIRAEAEKEAAWNPDLRRALPGGVKSEGEVGTPGLIQHPPKTEEEDEEEED